MATEKQLDILHDHYKETFARIRDLERSRDRLFLWVILLFALLSLEIGYSAEFGGSVQNLTIAGGQLDLGAVPAAALLSASWVLTLAMSLRYCQTSIAVDRQYPYLHHLEEVISPALGGGDLYRREGAVYLRQYPLMLNAAWYAYVVLFPLIAAVATVGLVIWEWAGLSYPALHGLFDTVVAAALVSFFLLYRVQPYVARRWTGPTEPEPSAVKEASQRSSIRRS